MSNPPPYVPRFSAGESEVVHVGDGLHFFDVPTVDILYPGEEANVVVRVDPEDEVARYTIYVTPSPGLRARLLRLRYRCHLIGRWRA